MGGKLVTMLNTSELPFGALLVVCDSTTARDHFHSPAVCSGCMNSLMLMQTRADAPVQIWPVLCCLGASRARGGLPGIALSMRYTAAGPKASARDRQSQQVAGVATDVRLRPVTLWLGLPLLQRLSQFLDPLAACLSQPARSGLHPRHVPISAHTTFPCQEAAGRAMRWKVPSAQRQWAFESPVAPLLPLMAVHLCWQPMADGSRRWPEVTRNGSQQAVLGRPSTPASPQQTRSVVPGLHSSPQRAAVSETIQSILDDLKVGGCIMSSDAKLTTM